MLYKKDMGRSILYVKNETKWMLFSRKVPNLVWKGSGHWAAIAAGFVFAFHEKG